jgi:hypothetical protein
MADGLVNADFKGFKHGALLLLPDGVTV